jgi:hypothetical protein
MIEEKKEVVDAVQETTVKAEEKDEVRQPDPTATYEVKQYVCFKMGQVTALENVNNPEDKIFSTSFPFFDGRSMKNKNLPIPGKTVEEALNSIESAVAKMKSSGALAVPKPGIIVPG